MKIVLVGDNCRELREVISHKTPNENLEFLVFPTITSSQEILHSDPTVDVVITDLVLSDGSAMDLLTKTELTTRESSPRIVVVGTDYTVADKEQLLEKGASEVIDQSSLQDRISEVLSELVADGRWTILAVDDDEMVLELISDVLELEDFNVIAADGGLRATELLEVNHVDAIVSDILMPGMSGLELLEVVREKYPSIPLVLVSGHPGKYRPEEVLLSGAAAYIRKPFKNAELVDSLRKALASHPQSHGRSHCLLKGDATLTN